MKLRSVAFLTVVGAGTLISATAIGSYLVSVSTLCLLLTITEGTASSFVPLSVIGAVLLSSTPASAAKDEKKVGVTLQGDISGSQNRHGRDVSAGAQVAVPLGGNSQLEFGGRFDKAFSKDGGSYSYGESHVRLNKDFGGGLTGHVGAKFPGGGAPQPHIGINFERRF